MNNTALCITRLNETAQELAEKRDLLQAEIEDINIDLLDISEKLDALEGISITREV